MRKLLYAVTVVALSGLSAATADGQETSPTPGSTPAPVPPRPVGAYGWVGFNANNGWAGGYGGAMLALNGSLATEGFILRADVSGGQYRFNPVSPGGSHRIYTENGDILVGYRLQLGPSYLTGYVGPAVEHHDNSDPRAHLKGTEGGVKGLVEYFTPIQDRMEFSGYASIATPFTTYNAAGYLAYRVTDSIAIGPGLAFFGDEAYKDIRIGPHFALRLPSFGELDVDGGYRHPFTNQSNGYFVTIGFNFAL